MLTSCQALTTKRADHKNATVVATLAAQPHWPLQQQEQQYLSGTILFFSHSTPISFRILDANTLLALHDQRSTIYFSRGFICLFQREGAFLFTLAHEVAHQVLEHSLKNEMGDQQQLELAADRYALSEIRRLGGSIHDALNALEVLLQVRGETGHASHPLIRERMHTLITLYDQAADQKSLQQSSNFKALRSALQCSS
jgi:hypothetical protein